MSARNGPGDSRGGPLTTDRPTAENPGEKFEDDCTPTLRQAPDRHAEPLNVWAHGQPPDLEQIERACDDAFLHLVGAGLVGTLPADHVVATLRKIMVEAHALHEDESPARRWRSA